MKGMEISLSKKQNQEIYRIIIKQFDKEVCQFPVSDDNHGIEILENLLGMFNHLKNESSFFDYRIREDIHYFADEMEKIMRKHDSMKGDTWKRMDDDYLIEKLKEEYNEVIETRKIEEFIDLANICMMYCCRTERNVVVKK